MFSWIYRWTATMPEQISVGEFVSETWEDYNSPTTSNFVPKMGHCRNTVSAIEEVSLAFFHFDISIFPQYSSLGPKTH